MCWLLLYLLDLQRAPCLLSADMNKRNIMNLILLGGIGLPVAGLAGPYALFFVPKGYVSAQQAGMQNRPV